MVDSILSYSYTFITVGLLYYFLSTSLARNFTLKKNIQWWILFGFLFNFISFTWLYTVYPLIWMPQGISQIIGISILHVSITIFVSICFSIVGYFLEYASRKKIPKVYLPLIFGGSLMIAELFRSIMLSIVFYGNRGTVDLHFTSGTIGNALSITPLIEFAYFGGTFALTFILGYVIYCCVSKTNFNSYWKHLVVIFIMLLGVHFFVPTYGPREPITIGVITTNFSTVNDDIILNSFKGNNVVLDSLTHSFTDSKPDIIVYPEDARYIEYLVDEQRLSLSKIFPNTLFVDGATKIINNKSANVSFLYNSETQRAIMRGKSFLLPFNEYIPYFFKPLFELFIPKTKMTEYINNHTYTPVYSEKVFPFKQLKIGTLICSEIISYSTIQDIKKENPTLVFYQAHLNVFHNNPLFRMHLYSFTKIAAAQLRRPLISSVNGAPSLIVSPFGSILTVIPAGFSTSTFIVPQ